MFEHVDSLTRLRVQLVGLLFIYQRPPLERLLKYSAGLGFSITEYRKIVEAKERYYVWITTLLTSNYREQQKDRFQSFCCSLYPNRHHHSILWKNTTKVNAFRKTLVLDLNSYRDKIFTF